DNDQKKRTQAGQLIELIRWRFAAARADGMFWKDLQAAVFAIHQKAPGRKRALPCLHARCSVMSCGARRYWTKGRLWGTGRKRHSCGRGQGNIFPAIGANAAAS